MKHVEKVGRVGKFFARCDRFEPLGESVVRGHDHRKSSNQVQGFLSGRRGPTGRDRNTSDVSGKRGTRHAQCVHRVNPSRRGSLQQLQRVPFEFPVGRELSAEPIESFRIRQYVVPQEEHHVLKRYVGREILHGESTNDEFFLPSIDAADRGLSRDDTFEPWPITIG